MARALASGTTLRKAEEKLKDLNTAEGTPLPENTRAELCRHLARLRVVRGQIRAVEQQRLRKLAAAPAAEDGSHAMVRLIARVLGVGKRTLHRGTKVLAAGATAGTGVAKRLGRAP